MARTFFDVPLLRHSQEVTLEPTDLGILLRVTSRGFRELLLSEVEGVLAHAQARGYLPERLTPLRELRDGISLEIVAERGSLLIMASVLQN
ncbi:hypothetical protein BMI85_12350 [Thioclava sp. DLFJ4-1]|nr:hypothetical protein BMI85_12350 [Thioclava sp. DLFJ4-1]